MMYSCLFLLFWNICCSLFRTASFTRENSIVENVGCSFSASISMMIMRFLKSLVICMG
ncbi:hypothetical protein ECANGB1_2692 [Enterospora canceri]|uniref:Uncharacterized protein n=1 Tax=Enterospora canceri TaxID=1081671 RepID=A0A1Y1S9A4_9MICR|nr:hypothetical protein ECANGB1_2692 [Enterospora canceri]